MNSSPSLHPELLEYFADQQREQQHYVRTAEVQRNVRATKEATLALLDKYIARGVEMTDTEQRAEQVMRQSQDFAHEAQGVNRFYACWVIPLWWFDCQPAQRVTVPAAARWRGGRGL
jgi:hypothetical protein